MTQRKKKLHRKKISWRSLGKNRRVKHKKPVRMVNSALKLTWDDRIPAAANYAELGLQGSLVTRKKLSGELHDPALTTDDFGDADEAMDAVDAEATSTRGEALPALEAAGVSRLVRLSRKVQKERDRRGVMSFDDQVYWSTLLAKHGSDYYAMQMDRKLNTQLHGQEKCKKMCELYMKYYAAETVPRK